jgi:hypothetical protein
MRNHQPAFFVVPLYCGVLPCASLCCAVLCRARRRPDCAVLTFSLRRVTGSAIEELLRRRSAPRYPGNRQSRFRSLRSKIWFAADPARVSRPEVRPSFAAGTRSKLVVTIRNVISRNSFLDQFGPLASCRSAQSAADSSSGRAAAEKNPLKNTADLFSDRFPSKPPVVRRIFGDLPA